MSSSELSDDDLVTPARAAQMLGVSVTTIRDYAKAGLLPAVNLPTGHRRYRVGVLRAIARGEVPGEVPPPRRPTPSPSPSPPNETAGCTS